MRVETIKSVSEYLKLIHKSENREFNWYRGHTKTSYRLEPTLYRNKSEVITGEGHIKFRQYEVKDEKLSIAEFKNNLRFKINNYEYNDLDYLYLMQHNGIETRLLDFSSNALIALFFSVVVPKKIEDNINNYLFELDGEFASNCSAVFCINPKKINLVSFNIEKVINFENKSFNELSNLCMPVCIEPANLKIDKRLEVQDGKFVLFGSEVKELDWYEMTRKQILKVLIPDEFRSKILEELESEFNINYSTVYPDYEGLRKHVQFKTKDNYSIL